MPRPEHIRNPAPATLAKYGLTLKDWLRMVRIQRWQCAVCGKVPKRFVIDHEHIAGWRHMDASTRRTYVRGLTCDSCNHFVLTRYADSDKHRRAADYLDDYADRRMKELGL